MDPRDRKNIEKMMASDKKRRKARMEFQKLREAKFLLSQGAIVREAGEKDSTLIC